MKNGSLLSFLKPKPVPVPSTVRDAGPWNVYNLSRSQRIGSVKPVCRHTKGGEKSINGDDVILPNIDMCLIT